MKSSLIKSLSVIFMLTASMGVRASNDIAEHIDFDDNYIKVEFLPLCNAEGQFKVVLSNVSDLSLLVEQDLFKAELFNPSNFGLNIRQVSNSERVKMKEIQPQVRLPDAWFKLDVGQHVEHIIDLRTMTEGVLVSDNSYTVGMSKMIKVIKPEGEIVYVDIFTNKQLKQFTVAADCFQ
jgi:hypothetical protein